MPKKTKRKCQLEIVSIDESKVPQKSQIYFYFKLKNSEEFEGWLEKRKGKGGKRRKKKEKSDKTHFKITYEA